MRRQSLKILGALCTVAVPFAAADWRYLSRPDLSPPTLNITIPATSDVDSGYIFVAQYPGFEGARAGPEQPAAYILRNDGDLVWSSLGYFAGWVGNFQAARYKGIPVLQAFSGNLDSFHGHGYGVPMLLDDHYRPVVDLQSVTHKLISIHEFKIVDEKTALVEIYQPHLYDLSPYGATSDEQWVANGVFQEIDLETGALIFEGRTLDFADPSNSVIPLRSGRAFTGSNASDAWDYFHINSVDKDDENNYLISGRHVSAIFKISGRDGSVIWQLGGKNSSFALGQNMDFGYQHDARFRSRSPDGKIEIISFFDNSARSDRQRTGGVDLLHPHSRGRLVQLNHTSMTATALQTFIPPDGISTWSQGNVQVLDSGNVFINWGQSGAVTEYLPNGTAIFHAYLDSGKLAPGVQSYRGFRYEWEGHSRETPAIVALYSASSKSASFHVSWNGDTVTQAWRFMCQFSKPSSSGANTLETYVLGEATRTSFETTLRVTMSALRCAHYKDCRIFAQALDTTGKIIGQSGTVHMKKEIEPAWTSKAAASVADQNAMENMAVVGEL